MSKIKQTLAGGYYLKGKYNTKSLAESDIKKMGRTRNTTKIMTYEEINIPSFIGKLFGEKKTRKIVYLLYLK